MEKSMKSLRQSTLLALTLALVAGFAGAPAYADDMAKGYSTMPAGNGDAMMKKDDQGKMNQPNAMMKPDDKTGSMAKKPDAMMKSDAMAKDKMAPDSGAMGKY
jgi:hypothetical protein